MGRKTIIWLTHADGIPSLKEARSGSEGRSLQTGTEGNHRGVLVTALLPKAIYPGVAQGAGPSHISHYQENAPTNLSTDPTGGGIFSDEVPSSHISSFYRVGKTSSGGLSSMSRKQKHQIRTWGRPSSPQHYPHVCPWCGMGFSFLFSRPRNADQTGHVTATMGRDDKMLEERDLREKGSTVGGRSLPWMGRMTGAGGSCPCCVHSRDAERGESWGAASVSRVIVGPWVGVTTPRMNRLSWTSLETSLQTLGCGSSGDGDNDRLKITLAFVPKAAVRGLYCCLWSSWLAGRSVSTLKSHRSSFF